MGRRRSVLTHGTAVQRGCVLAEWNEPDGRGLARHDPGCDLRVVGRGDGGLVWLIRAGRPPAARIDERRHPIANLVADAAYFVPWLSSWIADRPIVALEA